LVLTLPPLATIYLRWHSGLPEVLPAEKKSPGRKPRQVNKTEDSAAAEPAAKRTRRKPVGKKADAKTEAPARSRKQAGESLAVAAKPDSSRKQVLTEKKPSREKAAAAGDKKTAGQEVVQSVKVKPARPQAPKPTSVKTAVKPAGEDKKNSK
jgi:hypothetical protein